MDALLHRKPNAVFLAVKLLWVWLVFLAVSGVYSAWVDTDQIMNLIPPELMQNVPPQFQFTPRTIFLATAAGYLVLAAGMIGVVIRTGQGRNWARITLLISFILDLLISVFSSYHGIMDYILLVVDMGLQIYVLWLLYTPPGRDWFKHRK